MNTSRLAQLGEAAGFFVPEWIVFFGGGRITDCDVGTTSQFLEPIVILAPTLPPLRCHPTLYG